MENVWKELKYKKLSSEELVSKEEVLNKIYYAAKDEDFIFDLLDNEIYKNMDKGRDIEKFGSIKLDLRVVPLHYIGDIENAKILILSLNPGIDKEYINFYIDMLEAKTETDEKKYEDVIKDNLNFTKRKFFEFDYHHLQKKVYWSKLKVLFPKKYEEKIKKIRKGIDTTDLDKYFTRNIALVEFFPYHSQKYDRKLENLIDLYIKKKGEYLPSQKFVFRLIENRIREKDVTIVIARSKKKWMEAISGLSSYEKCFVCSNYRNPSFKKENLLKANDGDSVFNLIK